MTAPTDRIADTLKLGRPASSALAAAGIVTFADLLQWTREDAAHLHGIGPKALRVLDAAMSARGLTYKAP